jgi:hypothetical protein
MPWGRCDDTFWQHAKVLALQDRHRLAAVGLYWSAISWSNDRLADGHVSLATARILSGSRALADELVRVRLWEGAARDGYRIHDYLDFNRSRVQVEEERRKWAAERARRRANVSAPDTTADTTADKAVVSAPDSREHAYEHADAPGPFSRNPVGPSPLRDGPGGSSLRVRDAGANGGVGDAAPVASGGNGIPEGLTGKAAADYVAARLPRAPRRR